MVQLKEELYDVTIIGTGPAGLTAAVYTCRADLKTVVFEGEQPGGQLTTTTDVENYPGFREGINGFMLMDEMRHQAVRFGAEVHVAMVTDIEVDRHPFVVHLDDGSSYQTKTVVVATGARPRKLGLEGEQTFWANGVSSCATCDGAFFRDRTLAVVGGGDSAMEEATFLTKFASKVTIIHRREELRASAIMQKRAFDNPKVEFLYNHTVEDIYGHDDHGVKGLKVKDVRTGAIKDFPVDGLFLGIGHIPNTDVFAGKLEMDDEGYILTAPDSTRTNVPGVFAVGDVQDKIFRQAITAAGTGCMGALEAEHFLNELED
ncbi:MAG: thioredoxin-disulfide reductase, partial [Myxococcota bacterium]